MYIISTTWPSFWKNKKKRSREHLSGNCRIWRNNCVWCISVTCCCKCAELACCCTWLWFIQLYHCAHAFVMNIDCTCIVMSDGTCCCWFLYQSVWDGMFHLWISIVREELAVLCSEIEPFLYVVCDDVVTDDTFLSGVIFLLPWSSFWVVAISISDINMLNHWYRQWQKRTWSPRRRRQTWEEETKENEKEANNKNGLVKRTSCWWWRVGRGDSGKEKTRCQVSCVHVWGCYRAGGMAVS